MGKKECSWDYLTVMDSCNVSQKWRLWCQNDTPSGAAFSFKGERNIAHLLSFVQEIHAFDRRNWLRIRPKVRLWGCGISGLGPE